MRNRSDPWDKRLIRWLDWNWEFIAVALFAFIIGFLIGVFAMMIQHQHQIISVMEGLQ